MFHNLHKAVNGNFIPSQPSNALLFRLLSTICKQKIGIVGLGQMGSKLAYNFSVDEYEVIVYDRIESMRMNAVKSHHNIISSESVEALTSTCETIISILPNDQACMDVSIRLLNSAKSTLYHISCSTISPECSRELSKIYKSKSGCHFISAPVFARPDGLAKRQATWMISGGDSSTRSKAATILSKLGNTHDFGDDAAAANVVKLCGNFLIASSIEAIAESMTLAEKSGVNKEKVMQLLSSSMPFLSILLDRYVSSKAKGRGAMDWSAIGMDVAENAGIDINADLEKNRD